MNEVSENVDQFPAEETQNIIILAVLLVLGKPYILSFIFCGFIHMVYVFFSFIFRGFKQMKYFHPFLLRGFILTYIHFFPLDLYILDKFIHLFFPWNAKYEIYSFIHLRVFIHMKHIHSIRFCGFVQMIYTHSFIFHRKFYHSSLLRGFILKKYFHSFIYLWI